MPNNQTDSKESAPSSSMHASESKTATIHQDPNTSTTAFFSLSALKQDEDFAILMDPKTIQSFMETDSEKELKQKELEQKLEKEFRAGRQHLEWHFDWLGGITTALAMVPQGILGGLLADKIVREEFTTNPIPRVIALVVVGIGAEEGKRWLVRFFNTRDFKEFSYLRGKDFNPLNWTLRGVVNGSFTVVASGVFGGLGIIAFDDIAKLFQAYNDKYADAMASVFQQNWLKAIFAGASFGANLVGFPNIHGGAISLLRDGAYYLRENPAYRKLRTKRARKIEAARQLFLQAHYDSIEQKAPYLATDCIAHIVTNATLLELDPVTITHLSDLGYTQATNTYSSPFLNQLDEIMPKPQSWPEFFVAHIPATFFTGVGVAGLYNFRFITKMLYNMIPSYSKFPALASYIASSTLQWMDVASMSGLAASGIYLMAYDAVSSLFGRNPSLQISSAAYRRSIMLLTFLVCGVGGSPNVYQSVIARETLLLEIAAELASFLIECNGMYTLWMIGKYQQIIDANSDIKLANTVNQILLEALKLIIPTIEKQRPLLTSGASAEIKQIESQPAKKDAHSDMHEHKKETAELNKPLLKQKDTLPVQYWTTIVADAWKKFSLFGSCRRGRPQDDEAAANVRPQLLPADNVDYNQFARPPESPSHVVTQNM